MKKTFSVLLTALCALTLAAAPAKNKDPHEKWYVFGDTERNPVSGYKMGEPITFTLRAELDGKPAPANYTLEYVRTGDDFKTETGKSSADKPLKFTTKIDQPGFVRVRAFLIDEKGKKVQKVVWGRPCDLTFEGGAGASVAQIAPSEPIPEDFDAFWAAQRKMLDETPLKLEMKKIDKYSNDKHTAYYIRCNCPGGVRELTAILCIPNGSGKFPALVTYEHHGVGKSPRCYRGDCSDDRIKMRVNAHGYELDQPQQYYNDFEKSIRSNGKGYAIDPVQNSVRENAYFYGMVLRDLRALQVVKSLPQWNGKDLTVNGGSQGGLRTAWCAALDPQVTKAVAQIPWCHGVGMTIVGKNRTWGPQGTPALRYFDPVYLVKNIQCPYEVEIAGLGDYTSPPRGVAAFYNALHAPKKIMWVQGGWHNPKVMKEGIPYRFEGDIR